MTEKQLDMMKHAWGFDSREPGFRDHYCVEKTNPDIISLVSEGYFGGEYEGPFVAGCAMYYLTPKAIEKLQSMKFVEMMEKKKARKK